jgi:hypothetical protein
MLRPTERKCFGITINFLFISIYVSTFLLTLVNLALLLIAAIVHFVGPDCATEKSLAAKAGRSPVVTAGCLIAADITKKRLYNLFLNIYVKSLHLSYFYAIKNFPSKFSIH